MKRISSLTLLLALFAIDSLARENPFEPTDTYEQKKQEYYQKIEDERLQKEKELETARLQEELLMKREQELQALEIQKQQEIQRLSELQKKREILQGESPQVMFHEQDNVKDLKSYKVLPFVTIQTTDNALIIVVDTKFPLKNQDILQKEKKFLFDFTGNTNFYTIRKSLQHDHFKAYAIGTHKEKGFFRVVIDLEDDTKKYKETIDTQQGIIKIEKVF